MDGRCPEGSIGSDCLAQLEAGPAKEIRRQQSQNRGSTLTVTLLSVSLIGFFIFAYLDLGRTQRILEARSQAWNAALATAEAGVEEALAQLNPGAPSPVVDRTANGWGAPVGNLYGPVSRTLTNVGSYSVVFTTDPFPIIYSTGYVSVPYLSSTIARPVRVETTNTPLFSAAIVAKYDINLAGNGVATDSFNSANPSLSTAGRYDSSKASTNGDIASVMGIINVANGDVKGTVLLGPTATDSVSANGVITGGVSNDFNVEMPDVVLPQTNWLPAIATNVSITSVMGGTTNLFTANYQYAFGPNSPCPNGSGYYAISGLSGGIYVTNANVTLLLTGNASPPVIYLAGTGPTAGKLTIYMDGPTFGIGGSSYIDSGNATNLTYYGTTNNTQISISGNAAYCGTIYAPEANLKLSGGGSGTYSFIGATVTKTVTINGHFQFHYDENLALVGPKRGFVPRSWRELNADGS